MDPADLLYADIRRINAYFTQIRGHTGRLRLTGSVKLSYNPSAELHLAETTTKATPFDKIDAIRKYLDRRRLLRFGRPAESDSDVDFVEELCNATKVEIPARRGAPAPTKKISLWACSPELTAERSGILVLVEDFNYPDERATSFHGASTFSVLAALVYNTRREINDSALNIQLRHEPHPNPHATFGTESHPWSLSEHHSVRDYIYEFATNPVELLRSWNCQIYPERRINDRLQGERMGQRFGSELGEDDRLWIPYLDIHVRSAYIVIRSTSSAVSA